MRRWLAIPIVGVIAAAIAGLLGARGVELACAAAAGAAVVHALRVFAGESPAAITGAVAGALLAIVTIAERGHDLALPWLALACASWTFAELARPTATPYVALAPAIAAAIVEPACVALVAIAGARLVTARSSRPVIEAALRAQLDAGESAQLPLPGHADAVPRHARGAESASHARVDRSSKHAARGDVTSRHAKSKSAGGRGPAWRAIWSTHGVLVAPIAGTALVVLAIVTGTAHEGALGSLATSWFGPRVADATPVSSVAQLADALGPIAVVAAAAGLAILFRVHLASLAIVACAAGALLVDLRTGAPGGFTLGLASLCAGAGIARLAGMIRLASGQAITAATCGVMLLVPPIWTAIG